MFVAPYANLPAPRRPVSIPEVRPPAKVAQQPPRQPDQARRIDEQSANTVRGDEPFIDVEYAELRNVPLPSVPGSGIGDYVRQAHESYRAASEPKQRRGLWVDTAS